VAAVASPAPKASVRHKLKSARTDFMGVPCFRVRGRRAV
jgi:hypothetical protein